MTTTCSLLVYSGRLFVLLVLSLSVSNLKEVQEDTNQLVKELAEDTVNKFEEFFKSVSEGFEKFCLH